MEKRKVTRARINEKVLTIIELPHTAIVTPAMINKIRAIICFPHKQISALN